ncbi:MULTISPECIES: hypothetical protein [unclassified Actinoplanes]|uniref:hypothetical protein n=1 Tax=unclassified Actinoplanes TaxID=2626549 RepID=UPI0012BA79E8|nr:MULTISPECIES: hypothetical protein [unclassified Actinoplanes]
MKYFFAAASWLFRGETEENLRDDPVGRLRMLWRISALAARVCLSAPIDATLADLFRRSLFMRDHQAGGLRHNLVP